MALSLIILKQIILMFIYMTIGFLLYKKKFVTKQGSQELGMILLYVILPTVIVKAYLVTFSFELLRGLAISFLASLLALLLSMFLSRAAFGRKYPIWHRSHDGKKGQHFIKKNNYKSYYPQFSDRNHPVPSADRTAGNTKHRRFCGLVHECPCGNDHSGNLSGADKNKGIIYR